MYGNFKERAIGMASAVHRAAAHLQFRRCTSSLTCLAEYVKEAVAEDRAENYERAFELYMTALEFFKTHLKYEKNPKSKEAITAKVRRTIVCQACLSHSNHNSGSRLQFKEYLQRAEDIKALLGGQQPVTATPASGAQKAKPGGGGGSNGGGGGGGADVSFLMIAARLPCTSELVMADCFLHLLS